MTCMRISLLSLTLLVSACASSSSQPTREARKPNIVVILTDDQGWGDLSLNGNTNLRTPNVDSLARDGASFDRFYVCPVCSPTRAEFLTGRYHPRGGVFSTSTGGERLDLDEMTIAESFKASGYATGAFGKWHNGMQYPYHPNGRGFDEFYGFCSGHWGDYFSPPLEHNGKIVRGKGYMTNDFTERAMNFIAARKDRPFFAYLAYNTPHSPMQVPDKGWNRFGNKELGKLHREPKRENIPHTRAALAMCENIDWNVGRLLRKLDDLGIADNTIVVYFCDNGPNGYRWNGGMKGRKGSTDEGGVRSPLLVRWPVRIAPGKRVDQISAAIDLLPTLTDLAGIPVRSKKPLDGVSVKSLLLEPGSRTFGDRPLPGGHGDSDRMIFSTWRGRVSVRTQRYRLDNKGGLFDMVEDPGQRREISKREPRIAAKLRAAVKAWQEKVLGEMAKEPRPFTVGHPDYRYTQLPARDATAEGGIKRSGKAPNCSYFTNWTSLEGRITWDVDVLETGDYEVEMHYACPEADLGATVELSFGEARLRGRISKAHDPPVRGADNDRVKRRGESYVKDFMPMKLGTMRLERGKGVLTLGALENPGGQVMELRLLMLKRKGTNK